MADRSTILIARIIGPAFLVFGAALLAGRIDFARLVDALIADPTLRLFAAVISLILGLILAVLHNRWRSPSEAAITVIGWVLILRGASLLVAPPEMLTAFRPLIEAPALPLISGGLMVAIGGWFSYIGSIKKSS